MSKDKKKTEDEDISIEILSDYDDDELAQTDNTKKTKAKDLSEGYDLAWTALQTQVEEQNKQLEELQKETASLTDQLQRKQAEFDNYRKGIDRERSEFYQHGRREVLLEMLTVLDNFERAMMSAATTDDGAAFRQGVELIYKQRHEGRSANHQPRTTNREPPTTNHQPTDRARA